MKGELLFHVNTLSEKSKTIIIKKYIFLRKPEVISTIRIVCSYLRDDNKIICKTYRLV